MTHFVVILDWASDGERDTAVKAVTHTIEEAKVLFAELVVDEKIVARDNSYEVEEDTDCEFYAFEMGYEAVEHTKLYIQEVS